MLWLPLGQGYKIKVVVVVGNTKIIVLLVLEAVSTYS